ncbi:uncharacterized protein LOC129582282 [Paramacrobiotus metropolitanus]|uniref:uncharacterized protein LOC129582282 n=1 Tax=Paramacrobiotus metropolitanus TaxID=2943436 RepID=UPI0024461886|nr:uncharacterized protein LOC129582282 [Paramacrobiotus metropolitanus]
MGNSNSVTDDTVQHIGRTMQYRYSHVDDFIGKGSYGIVYKAKVVKRGDYAGDDFVAVKVMQICITSEALADHDNLEEAVRKLKKLIALSHENLVKYHKISITKVRVGATVELAMDYHEGDLGKFLREARHNRALLRSYMKVSQLVTCIARGLEFLHANLIIHGDLKPGNVLVAISERGRRNLLISDLDDIVHMQGNATCSADLAQLRGTKRYMSPEMLRKFSQISTESPGRKTDIWSLGCIILEMAEISCGVQRKQLVKDGDVVEDDLTDDQYVIKIIDGYVPFVSNDIAGELASPIRKCLQPVAAERICAKEVGLALSKKQVILLFNDRSEFDRTFLILFDPVTGCFKIEKFDNAPASLRNRRSEIRIHHGQLGEVERIFEVCSNSSNGRRTGASRGSPEQPWPPVTWTRSREYPFVIGTLSCEFSGSPSETRLHSPQGRLSIFFLWNLSKETWREIILPSDVCLAKRLILINNKCYYWNWDAHFMKMDIKSGTTAALDNGTTAMRVELGSSTALAITKCGEHIYYATASTLCGYDTMADKWEEPRKLPEWRTKFAMGVVNGYIYIISGRSYMRGSYMAIADCIRLQVGTGSWEEIQPLGRPRYDHSACIVHDRIFVCGGKHSETEHALEIEVYDTTLCTGWSTVALLPKDMQLLSQLASECTDYCGIGAMTLALDDDIDPNTARTQ